MASNSNGLVDYYNKHPDWLEIYNPDTAAVDLSSWQLKQNSNTWTIPSGVSLAANSYLVIYCDEKNLVDPAGKLHTNFKLGASGDYLALLKPDNTVVSAYSPAYPQQITDVSYGVSTSLIGTGSSAKAFIPTDASLGTTWRGDPANDPFNDSSWTSGTTGVGYSSTIGSANMVLRLNANSSSTITTDTQTAGSTHIVTNVGNSVSWVSSLTDEAIPPIVRSGLMQFNAAENDQITVNTSSDWYNTTNGTISFWMNSTGTVSGTGDGAVLLDMRSTSRGILITQTNEGFIRLRCYKNSPNFTLVHDLTSAASVSDGKWHAVSINYNKTAGGTCSIYIDGVSSISGAHSLGWEWSTSTPLEIGRCTNSSHTTPTDLKNYNGLIDDFRFYNTQLTPTNISDIYNELEGGVSASDIGLSVQGQMQNNNATAYIRRTLF